MSASKVPSLQHLARFWHDTPQRIAKKLVELALNSPTFSYDPLYLAVRDMLVLGVPYEQIVEGIRRAIRRDGVRENFLSTMPLINGYFEGVSPTFVQAVSRSFYPIGRGLLVPFQPPLIYGASGELHFPWFSFWRSNPIKGEALSLFVTMVDEMLMQDPDLETAKFTILDFSAPAPKKPRDLKIIKADDIARVNEKRKQEMLEIFAEGFLLAQAQLAAGVTKKPSAERSKETSDDDQLDMF